MGAAEGGRVKRLLIAAAVLLLVFAAGASAVSETNTPNMSGHFDWTVYADGITFKAGGGTQYRVQWYFEGENGYQYWLGEGVTTPYRTPITTTVVLRESLPDIAGCEYQPDPCDLYGDYYATIYKADGEPLLDAAGNPYTFEQDFDR
jgi:hypothetical protein